MVVWVIGWFVCVIIKNINKNVCDDESMFDFKGIWN